MSRPLAAVQLSRSLYGSARRILSFMAVLLGVMANAAWIAVLCWLIYGVVADQI
jgi:hypothetical protein